MHVSTLIATGALVLMAIASTGVDGVWTKQGPVEAAAPRLIDRRERRRRRGRRWQGLPSFIGDGKDGMIGQVQNPTMIFRLARRRHGHASSPRTATTPSCRQRVVRAASPAIARSWLRSSRAQRYGCSPTTRPGELDVQLHPRRRARTDASSITLICA